VGVHVNLAPVVDVNNNPRNPVINTRSFGEDPTLVVGLASAYIEGLKAEGMLAIIKHFPGHGDTDVDSHLGLPLLAHARDRLDEIELPHDVADLAQVSAVRALAGERPVAGRLPIALGEQLPVGHGLVREAP